MAIPTFRRAAQLGRCLQSLLAQEGVAADSVEILVVDNCPDASARSLVEEVRRTARAPIVYVHEPHPGISNARNTCLARASAPLLAFVDDDEVAAPDWLQAILEAKERLGAEMVFGRIEARLENVACGDPEFMRAFYSRDLRIRTGVISTPHYIGNALLDRAWCRRHGLRFETRLGLTGGEDSLFCHEAARAGARFAWCREAMVYEIVPPYRVTWQHVWLRSFVRGQCRTRIFATLSPPDLPLLAMYVLGGAAQFALNGIVALIACPVAPRLAARAVSHALKGLGKLFWMRPFHIEFYGAGGRA